MRFSTPLLTASLVVLYCCASVTSGSLNTINSISATGTSAGGVRLVDGEIVNVVSGEVPLSSSVKPGEWVHFLVERPRPSPPTPVRNPRASMTTRLFGGGKWDEPSTYTPLPAENRPHELDLDVILSNPSQRVHVYVSSTSPPSEDGGFSHRFSAAPSPQSGVPASGHIRRTVHPRNWTPVEIAEEPMEVYYVSVYGVSAEAQLGVGPALDPAFGIPAGVREGNSENEDGEIEFSFSATLKPVDMLMNTDWGHEVTTGVVRENSYRWFVVEQENPGEPMPWQFDLDFQTEDKEHQVEVCLSYTGTEFCDVHYGQGHHADKLLTWGTPKHTHHVFVGVRHHECDSCGEVPFSMRMTRQQNAKQLTPKTPTAATARVNQFDHFFMDFGSKQATLTATADVPILMLNAVDLFVNSGAPATEANNVYASTSIALMSLIRNLDDDRVVTWLMENPGEWYLGVKGDGCLNKLNGILGVVNDIVCARVDYEITGGIALPLLRTFNPISAALALAFVLGVIGIITIPALCYTVRKRAAEAELEKRIAAAEAAENSGRPISFFDYIVGKRHRSGSMASFGGGSFARLSSAGARSASKSRGSRGSGGRSASRSRGSRGSNGSRGASIGKMTQASSFSRGSGGSRTSKSSRGSKGSKGSKSKKHRSGSKSSKGSRGSKSKKSRSSKGSKGSRGSSGKGSYHSGSTKRHGRSRKESEKQYGRKSSGSKGSKGSKGSGNGFYASGARPMTEMTALTRNDGLASRKFDPVNPEPSVGGKSSYTNSTGGVAFSQGGGGGGGRTSTEVVVKQLRHMDPAMQYAAFGVKRPRACIWISLAVAGLMILGSLYAYEYFRPRDPDFRICGLTLKTFDIANLDVTLSPQVTIFNPNAIGIDVPKVYIDVNHRETKLGGIDEAFGIMPAREERLLEIDLAFDFTWKSAIALALDVIFNETVEINIVGEVQARVLEPVNLEVIIPIDFSTLDAELLAPPADPEPDPEPEPEPDDDGGDDAPEFEVENCYDTTENPLIAPPANLAGPFVRMLNSVYSGISTSAYIAFNEYGRILHEIFDQRFIDYRKAEALKALM